LAGWLRASEPDKAATTLRALLSSTPPEKLPVAIVSQTLRTYRVHGPAARALLTTIWADALTFFLRDGVLSTEEVAYLAALAKLLGLSETELTDSRQRVGRSAYKTAIQAAFGDGQISSEEWNRLEALKTALALPDNIHAEVYGPLAKAAFTNAVNEAAADRRLSPSEVTSLAALAKALHVDITFDHHTSRQLDKFARYWRIENGDIPTLDVPITLQRNEVAYWRGTVAWHEIRRRTTRVGFSGPTISIPIVKGVRWRFASFALHRITKDELTFIDKGTLYVTNKRVIFDGALKNTTIRYSSLIGFQLFSDAVILDKATGKSPHLLLEDDPEDLAVILGAAMAMAT